MRTIVRRFDHWPNKGTTPEPSCVDRGPRPRLRRWPSGFGDGAQRAVMMKGTFWGLVQAGIG